MALANIPVPAFPSIPQLPGVPPLPRILNDPRFSGVGGLPSKIAQVLSRANSRTGLLRQDEPNLPQPIEAAVWGLFDAKTGVTIAEADSIISVEYRNDYQIANYPQEDGAFASYNKVASPFGSRIRMTKGGSVDERMGFLNSISSAMASLNFVSIVTPEITYTSAQVVGYNYRRERTNGANFLIVEIMVEEVRVTGTATFSKTKEVSGQDEQFVGPVQPQPIPASKTTILTN